MTGQNDTPEAAVPHGAQANEDLPTNRLSLWLDRIIVAIGKAASWLWLAVLAVVLANVFSRFVMEEGSIALEELSWHLFGAAMMLTLAFAVVRDDHVRVDVIHEKFSARTRAIIDLVGILLLALPIIYLMVESLVSYTYTAYIYDERSQAPSGLPYRFIFKGVLALALGLVMVALFSRALRCCTLLFRFPRPLRPTDDRADDHSKF
ncbi:TRAP transporter small permease subunit [Marinobacter salicampi]|uniref:TRAP transporter small permease subunit n=1 Tax=Marinobacter salicampi TaxID=435907 RepID=UPI001F5F054C|nr:TRAP transporter small permease subunit [Marinobacter salicampi]